MRVLLDTQCFLWMAGQPERLSRRARTVLEDAQHVLYLSAASAWEIGIKHAAGKLTLPEAPASFVPSRMTALGVLPLGVHHAHALHVSTLPPHHRDPFDRLLVAQAQLEGLSILTSDPLIATYGVEVVSA